MKFDFGKKKLKKLIDNSVLKKKDSLIGLPVLFTLTGFSNIRQAHKPEVVNKIALLKITSIRDTIFTSSSVKALKKAYPNAEITYFTGEDNFNTASIIEGVDNTIRLFSNDLSKSMKIVKNAGYFDLWIDFGAWSRFEAIMTQTAKAAYKAGFKTEGEYRHFAYDKVADYSFDIHETANYAFLLSFIDIKVNSNEIEIKSTENTDSKLVIIDIFADCIEQKNRKYSQSGWKIIVEHLNKLGYRAALIGDKKDLEEAEAFNELAGSSADIDFLVGRLDFADKLKTISSAALVISGDTSILHIGAFLGKKVIGLYGPTDKKRYAPVGNHVYILSSNGCSGCQNLYGDEKCTMNIPDCMDSIPVESIISKIDLALGVNVE